MNDLFVLHKYFIYEETMRLNFEKYLIDIDNLNSFEKENRKSYLNIYLDLWYGTLYVLIE